MTPLDLDPRTTALVLIDLQHGILGRPIAPHRAEDVVARAARLAAALRSAGGTVVYVHVDLANVKTRKVDVQRRDPNAPPPPASASELVPDAGFTAGDLQVTKRSWGAFLGTGLGEELRSRGVETIVLGGVATNLGVESTARAAMDLGFELVLVEDAMSSISAEAHAFAVSTIFPLMGRVRSTAEVLASLGER